MVNGRIVKSDSQRLSIREEVTNKKTKWNLLETNISSKKLEKENIQKKNLQLNKEIKKLEETRLL